MGKLGCVCFCALGLVAGAFGARAAGPDVITGEMLDVLKYGPVGNTSAYVLGTLSCNIGNANAMWVANTNQHPVIATSIYRLKDGRLEQLGIGWLKHGYFSTNSSFCSTCQDASASNRLGVGCSDPYFAGINAEQPRLGPRSDVNAFTGVFSYPYTIAWQQSGDDIFKRIQVRTSDIDPAQNSGALYFGEGQYVTADDAAAGNQMNNASYRRLTVGAFTSGTWTLSFTDSTQQTKPAIYAWRERTNGVSGDDDTSVTIVQANVPSEGRFYLAYKVTALPGNLWQYDYAIQNLNSHRSVGSFSVPVPSGVNVTNIAFHDVDYHSGELYSTLDWTGVVSSGALTWATEAFTTNANASALRWGMMNNYRFVADRPPTTANVSLGLFRPGTPSSLSIVAVGPSAPPPMRCAGDANNDGVINNADLSVLLGQFGQAVTPNTGADFNGDGLVNNADLSVLLGRFNSSC